jgi:chromosome segregation ATPase
MYKFLINAIISVFILFLSSGGFFCLYAQEEEIAKENAMQHYRKGEQLYSEGHYQEATAEFEKAAWVLNPEKTDFGKQQENDPQEAVLFLPEATQGTGKEKLTNQISNLLAQKELELDNSQREATDLKEELSRKDQEKQALQSQLQVISKNLSSLHSKYEDLQTELNLLRQQQKKMVGELSKATVLNASLQKSLSGLSQSMAQEEDSKSKAQELKNKIEENLKPKENKE